MNNNKCFTKAILLYRRDHWYDYYYYYFYHYYYHYYYHHFHTILFSPNRRNENKEKSFLASQYVYEIFIAVIIENDAHAHSTIGTFDSLCHFQRSSAIKTFVKYRFLHEYMNEERVQTKENQGFNFSKAFIDEATLLNSILFFKYTYTLKIWDNQRVDLLFDYFVFCF